MYAQVSEILLRWNIICCRVFFYGGDMSKYLTWNKVHKVHKTVAGISTKNGLVNSLLCNTGTDQLYPNKIYKKKIDYYVGPRTLDGGINGIFKSWAEGNSFPVFQKLEVNKWIKLGDYKVSSHKKENGDFIAFILTKV